MDFSYHNPTRILFGTGSIEKLKKHITQKRILLVAGKESIKHNGVYEQIQDIARVQLWDVQPNPLLSKVREGIELARRHDVDAVLAAGGGSVIDSAKAIAAGVYVNDIWDYFGTGKQIHEALPLYTILTLSATGTEMNGNAVITNEDRKLKWAIQSPLLYPKISAIDPSVQQNLPWVQTANGAIDALSHCMEFYVTFTDQELSMRMNESIMQTILLSMQQLQNDEQSLPAREQLAWCAAMALNGMSGIGTTGDWASHALEHAISALFSHVAHAQGLAIILPSFMLHTQHENRTTYTRWANNVWQKQSVEEAVSAMQATFASWKAPTKLRDVAIAKNAIPALVQKAMQAGPLGRVKTLTKEDITQIFERAW